MQPQQPQQPMKQHIVMNYMIDDESMLLKKIEDNKYSLHFNYTAASELLCSVFTFVEESFNVESYTTENMQPDKKNGSEKHVALNPGRNQQAQIDGLRVVYKENYNFSDNLINNYYPLIIRLVGSRTDLGKQIDGRDEGLRGGGQLPLLLLQKRSQGLGSSQDPQSEPENGDGSQFLDS